MEPHKQTISYVICFIPISMEFLGKDEDIPLMKCPQ